MTVKIVKIVKIVKSDKYREREKSALPCFDFGDGLGFALQLFLEVR